MKSLRIYIPILLFLSCSGGESEKNISEFRIAQFITESNNIEYSISNEKGIVEKGKLNFKKVTEYLSTEPGTYNLTIKENNNLILNKKIGMGKGKYTLCLIGEVLKEQKANKITSKQKMHNIVAGAEGTTSNGYLPQLIILNDYFSVKKGKSKIRFIHTIPGLTDLSAKINKERKTKTIKKVKYPHPSESHTLKTGKHSIKIYYKDSPLKVLDTSMRIDQNKLYTSLLYRNSDNQIEMYVIKSDKH
ncbi:hypothetical protein OO013_16755 [Mangrovivirga sp. M17]|uniref:DUF4397 domain-containing protein n=1 Tax=Mangrovivirga halotolerans TaxID=2993936 RepID=A0ABT3RV70_9BACT|nr:hypothetical protein [Mangrovivirga halotolerans]MCX2745533.1 hypothetical protein [Mangrovivirga halotolerans]